MNDGQPEILGTMNNVKTTAELRRQLHATKANDRQAAMETTNATSTPTSFLTSRWATALFTSLASFLLLYISNPPFVQEDVTKTDGRFKPATPSMKKIFSWSVLVFLIVAIGPFLYQKFLANK